MITITSLWLPILLSAVIVFFASWIVHMVLPFHRSDSRKLPNEADVMEALRKGGAGPGGYCFPYVASPQELSRPEVVEKFRAGPVGFLTLARGGPPTMGSSLFLWFVYLIVVGIFVAYVTTRTLPPGTDYLSVFRVAGTVAFLIHAGAHPTLSIFYKRPWSTTFKFVFDGLLYGLLTAGVFGWRWP